MEILVMVVTTILVFISFALGFVFGLLFQGTHKVGDFLSSEKRLLGRFAKKEPSGAVERPTPAQIKRRQDSKLMATEEAMSQTFKDLGIKPNDPQ